MWNADNFSGEASALVTTAQGSERCNRVAAGAKRSWSRWPTLAAFLGLAAASAQGLAAIPQVTATFTSSSIITSIAAQNHTTLVFTLTTQAGDPPASNVNFTETLPSSLLVAPVPAKGGTCANAVVATTAVANATTISVANLQVPAGANSCTVTVDVAPVSGARNGSCAIVPPALTPPPAFTTLPANFTAFTNVTVNALTSSCVTVGTFPSLETPADRFGSDLNCTANDVSASNITVQGTTQCIFGQLTTVAISATISVTATQRSDIGIFFAQDGGDLQKTSATGGAASSSAVVLTQALGIIVPGDGDACFEGNSGTVNNYPLGLITVACTPNPATGFLDLKSLTTWDQNGTNFCGGPQDVSVGTKSKCTTGASATTVAVLGQINITKATIPASDPTVFNYTAANTTVPANAPTPTAFTLSNGLSQQIATAQLKQAGELYLVTEAADPNFTLTSIVCTNAAGMPAGNVTINVANRTVSANMSTINGIVNCTYTNTRKSFLTVNKAIVPATDPGQFNLTANATTVNNQGNGGTTGPVPITVGVAAPVSEAAGSGTALVNYTSSYACVDPSNNAPIVSGSGTSVPGGVTALNGQSIVCTFTNNRNPSVTVFKALVPTSDNGLFNLSAGATTVNNQGNGGSTGVVPGSLNTQMFVQETAGTGTVLANYTTTWSCNDGTSGSGASFFATPTSAVPAVVCTFTNTRKTQPVTLSKTLNPGADTGLFNLQINGGTVASNVGNGGSGGLMSVPVGSPVTIAELAGTGTNLANYTTVVGCSVSVTPGAQNQSGSFTMPDAPVACNFTNTRKQVPVTLQKTWVGAAPNDQVTITAGSHVFISVANAPNETDIDSPFAADAGSTIAISEAFNVGVAGNYASSLACTGNSIPLSAGNLTLAAADTAVTCTFTNSFLIHPGITKSFNPTSILSGGTSVLTFTIANPPAGVTTATGFTDTLPAGLQLANGTVGGTAAANCPGFVVTDASNAPLAAGSTSVKVANLTINPGVTCTFTANVTNKPGQTNTDCSTNPIPFTNFASSVTVVSSLQNFITPSCLVVSTQPTLTKSFSPTTINVGGTTLLTYTVDNTQAGALARSGLAFTDLLPASLVLANATVGGSCVGYTATDNANVALAAGSTSVKVINVSIAAAASCTITVNVTNAAQQVNPSCGALPAAFTNSASNISVITGITNGVQPSCVIVNSLSPSLDKSFSPTTINVGGVTTLTFTVTNPALNPALTNVGFVDTLPASLQIANPTVVGGTCGNAVAATTATAGTGTITVANLQLPAGQSSCTVTVQITNVPLAVNSSCSGSPAAFTNSGTNVVPTNVTSAITPSCVVVNPLVPSLNKAFNPTTMVVGGTTTLTFTVTNPAGFNPAQTVSFVDTLPAGLQIAAVPNVGGSCTGGSVTAAPGTNSIVVSGSIVPASNAAASSCTISVAITNVPLLAGSCPAANFTNTAGNISGAVNVTNNVTDSCVSVTELLPSLAKSFNPLSISVGGTTTLTFTITNPATNNPAQAVSFVDTLPSGLQVAATPNVGGTCTGGTVTAVGGTNSISLSGVMVPASGAMASTCTVSVDVTNVPLQAGTCPNANFTNSAGNLTGVVNVNTTSVVPSCVSVNPLTPSLNKAFSPTVINVGGTTTLTFTLTNPAAFNPAQAVSFVDTLPAGLQVAAVPNIGGSCAGGSVTAVAGAGTITVSGRIVPASNAAPSTCTITVDVTNAPQQTNASCAQTPANFTNTSLNIGGTVNITNAVSPSCVVVNPLSPTLNKAFSPTTIAVGGTTVLTFTVTNPAANPALSNVGFVDTLPAGLQLANATVGGTCVNAAAATTVVAGGSTITVANLQVGAGASSCTVTVNVTNVSGQTNASCAQTPANFTNAAGNVTVTNVTNGVTPSCVVVTPLPPTLTKAFSPNIISVGGTTVLTFTVTNPAGNPAVANVGFADTLPTGLRLANATVSGTCANAAAATTVVAGGSTITVANLQVGAGLSSCTVTVNVTNVAQQVNPSCAPTPATFTNASGNVTVTNVINGVTPSCVVVNPLPPVLNKAFSPSAISVGGTTVLTFTVTNPAANPALSNVGFVDTLPAGLQLANATVGGTCANAAAATTVVAGGSTITVANLQVGAGASSCTVTVNVTNVTGQTNASCAQTPANFTNSAGNVTVTNVTNGVTPSCVVVNPLQPTLNKAFSPSTISVGGIATLTFTISNPAGNPLVSNVGFVDTLPSGLQLANATVGGTCANAAAATTVAAGGSTITVTNLQVAAGVSSCTVTVNVTNVAQQVNPSCAQTPVAFTNATGNVTVTNVTNGVTPSCVVVNPLPPTLNKAFSPTTIAVGGTTVLTFTVTNPAANPALSNVGFVDTLPAGLQLANATVGGTCVNAAAATTVVAGGSTITVANLQVGAGASSCTVTVNVTNVTGQTNASCAQTPANFTNAAGNVTVTNVTNGVTPSCVVVTSLQPTLTKAFSPTAFNLGGTTTLTFTISNPAANPAQTNVGFVDNLPSGLQVANPAAVGGTCANAVAATTAAAGATTITVANLQVATGASSCTVTVSITNQPGQSNASCANTPAAFTNGPGNVTVTNVTNGVTNSCVVVNTFSFSITKSPSASTVTPGSPLSFTVTITNNGPAAADGAIVTDPAIPFFTASTVSCQSTTGGATCPAPLTIAAMQGAGMTIATLPAGATVTLRIDGTTSLASGSLINTVTVTPPAGIPGVASASATAAVAAQIGVIPTLSGNALIALMLLIGLASAGYLRRAKR